MRITALMADIADPLPLLDSTGPGPYGVRVHARGRDHNTDGVDFDPFEEYLVVAWPAPEGPPAAHKRSDHFGSELRSSRPGR